MPDEPATAAGLVANAAQSAGRATPGPSSWVDAPSLASNSTVLAAEALAVQEARHRELLAAIRTPIVSTMLDGRITGFNGAAVALFGSPARLYGRPIREVLPFVHDPLDSSGGDTQGRLADATGRTVDLEVSRTLLDDQPGRGSAVYVVHDISRQAEVNRLREQLLYGVAHELRGPLMVLDNALEILDADYDKLTAQDFNQVLGSARRSARRMRMLMEDLLRTMVVTPQPNADMATRGIRKYDCSFCGKSQDQVRRLIAGPGAVYICDECVDLCREIIDEEWPPVSTVSTGQTAHRIDLYTEPARKVLQLAQEEAQRFDHNYIGTEHLLLGLLREGEGVAAKVLGNLGVELNRVRSSVEFIIGRGTAADDIGLTPRAKKVLQLSVDEAGRLNHPYIGTEHLLLGLVREGEGIAAGVLESQGVSLGKVRSQVVYVLNQSAAYS